MNEANLFNIYLVLVLLYYLYTGNIDHYCLKVVKHIHKSGFLCLSIMWIYL